MIRPGIADQIMSTNPPVEAELPGRPLPREAWHMIVRRYAFVAEMACGRRLLDVGCGGGLGLRFMRRAGVASIVAVDACEANIRVARRLSGDAADVRHMDAHALVLPDSSVDVVSCMQVIQYLDVPRFIAEAVRVLAPGGLLIIEMPNIRRRDGFKASAAGRSYYDAVELAALLSAAGLTPGVFGAFAVPAEATRPSRQFLKRAKRGVVDCVLAIPGGERIKDAIVARVLPRVRVHEVGEADVAALDESTALQPLPAGDPGVGYQMIYVVGRAAGGR